MSTHNSEHPTEFGALLSVESVDDLYGNAPR